MPVFNPGRHLAAALASIKSQSFTDFELLVIDDGSTDGSTKVLEGFARDEPRMILTIRANLGLIATRNELLQAARGEFIAWMDADDISLPHRLARQVEAFSTDPTLVCVGTSAQCIDPGGCKLNLEQYRTSHPDIVAEQQNGGGMRFPTTMMRRRVASAIGGFREPFKIGEDLDFLIRLGEVGRLGNLQEILYLYRQSVSSVCANLGPHWIAYRDQILELSRQRRTGAPDLLQTGGSLTLPSSPVWGRRLRAHFAYTRWSGHALSNGDWLLAMKYSCLAVLYRPFAKDGWKSAAKLVLRMGAVGQRRAASAAKPKDHDGLSKCQ